MIYKEKIKIFCILYVFTREIKNRKNRIMNLKNKEGILKGTKENYK